MSNREINDPAVRKILEHRKCVLREFVDSETVYVERLRVAVEDYLNYIRSGAPDVPPTLKTEILPIFSTLPDIYNFHQQVLLPALLENSVEDADAMVGVFLKHGSEFTSKYVAYCKNKPISDTARVEYEEFFSSRQSDLGQKLNIEDLLIAPVQRLPRYQLLIRDLLKDTRKVNMDTNKIEEALELMQRIPKETNNMICMSLLRGIARASVISHGTLWRQDTILFSANGGKEESMQVYLFDHQIIIASPADSEGFYHFKQGIKTLNGKLSEGTSGEFSFTDDTGLVCKFRADKKDSLENWVKDLQSILTSQLQMKRALMFGSHNLKTRASSEMSRLQSIGLEWSDSDSSVDSLHDSDSDLEGDWPQQAGFQFLDSKRPSLEVTPAPKITKPKAKRKSAVESRKTFPAKKPITSISLPGRERPRSYHALSMDSGTGGTNSKLILRKCESLSISPTSLRKTLMSTNGDHVLPPNVIHYPHPRHSLPPPRSPGAFRRPSRPLSSSFPAEDMYYITVDPQPDTEERAYKPLPGQVFGPKDVRDNVMWRVKVLSGSNAGEEVWIQHNQIEPYTAVVALQNQKKVFSVINEIGRGRFSEVKQAKLKVDKRLVAVKVFKDTVSEESFFRELCICSRLKHDNLVKCVGGVKNGGMAIAMETINGRPLFEYIIRKASVTESMVAGCISQLLDALHYLHTHTIVHLDIRPSNLMIHITRTADVVKLVDFGAARHYGDETLCHRLEPSLEYRYVAPEVFQQEPVGPTTDMWAVGVLIYTIFHGCTPFQAGSNLHTLANITAAKYYIPRHPRPACSQEAIALIKSILVLSARSRPNAEAAKQYDWIKNSEKFKENKLDISSLQQFVRNQSCE